MSADRTAQAGSVPDRDACKLLAARAFDHGVRVADLTNDEVATALGIKATRVRALRSDDKGDRDAIPNIADLLMMGERQFEETVARVRAERLAIHGPPQLATLEDELLAALEADGEVQVVGARALRDRVVTPLEVPELEARIAASEQARARLKGLLRARAKR